LAAPKMILPMTILLFGGQVLPFLLLALSFSLSWMQIVLALLAVTFALLPRLIACRRFRQPVLSALLHPVGVIGLLCIQWYAFLGSLSGRPRQWRGRVYCSVISRP
jgi:hypothetical protein